jgi:hypothetical protein
VIRVLDPWYLKRSIAFLHQASRYRGKANYRDAIYLACGKSVPKRLDVFIDDLAKGLISFSAWRHTGATGSTTLR